MTGNKIKFETTVTEEKKKEMDVCKELSEKKESMNKKRMNKFL